METPRSDIFRPVADGPLTMLELAAYLRVHPVTVRKLHACGRIKAACYVGDKSPRFDPGAVVKALAKRKGGRRRKGIA